ncbi:MAG TPA: nicotinate-nucleotide adenylyltransferase [Hyphomicrobiales bacterium]|nr:nicotinate-nucleotide adenylyltransferase [Hyphomicrobiales bacterium]
MTAATDAMTWPGKSNVVELERSLPPACPGMRIGLFGGSFNPPHCGHRHISEVALKRMQLHRIWWLVTPGNPLKDTSGLKEIAEREAAARKAADHPRMIVTGFERFLPTPYAIDTARFLRRRFAGVEFVWIMGGDNLATFHLWRDWRGLFETLPIMVIDRPEARNQALASPAAQCYAGARLPESHAKMLPALPAPAWIYATAPLRDVSSTEIRNRRGLQSLK